MYKENLYTYKQFVEKNNLNNLNFNEAYIDFVSLKEQSLNEDKVRMNNPEFKNWLETEFVKKKTDSNMLAYQTKKTGEFIDMVNNPTTLRMLYSKGITDHVEHGIGFNPTEQKWYGWSHRAIYGFGIGSKVKKGDCAYTPKTEDEFIKDVISSYKKNNITYKKQGKDLVITYTDPKTNNIYTDKYEIPKNGKGEWTAKTLEDAKQMAQDFSNGVS